MAQNAFRMHLQPDQTHARHLAADSPQHCHSWDSLLGFPPNRFSWMTEILMQTFSTNATSSQQLGRMVQNLCAGRKQQKDSHTLQNQEIEGTRTANHMAYNNQNTNTGPWSRFPPATHKKTTVQQQKPVCKTT